MLFFCRKTGSFWEAEEIPLITKYLLTWRCHIPFGYHLLQWKNSSVFMHFKKTQQSTILEREDQVIVELLILSSQLSLSISNIRPLILGEPKKFLRSTRKAWVRQPKTVGRFLLREKCHHKSRYTVIHSRSVVYIHIVTDWCQRLLINSVIRSITSLSKQHQ